MRNAFSVRVEAGREVADDAMARGRIGGSGAETGLSAWELTPHPTKAASIPSAAVAVRLPMENSSLWTVIATVVAVGVGFYLYRTMGCTSSVQPEK